MNTAVGEVQRLREQLAEKMAELAELRELVQAHVEATAEDEQRCLDRERAAHQRGHREGREIGWRQGVEHALIAVDEAHLTGTAHDHEGQMRELGLHNGPVPEPATPEQRVGAAERYSQLKAAQIARQYERNHQRPEIQPEQELEAG